MMYWEKSLKSSSNINQKYQNVIVTYIMSCMTVLLKHNFSFLVLKNKVLMFKHFSQSLDTVIPWWVRLGFLKNHLNKLLLINALSGHYILYVPNNLFNYN